MSLFEKYACLYEDEALTAEDRVEVGEFVAGVIKCAMAKDKAGLNDLFDRHFAYADDETIEKIGRYVTHFSFYGEPTVKDAIEEWMGKEAGEVLEKIAGLPYKGNPNIMIHNQGLPSWAGAPGGGPVGSGVLQSILGSLKGAGGWLKGKIPSLPSTDTSARLMGLTAVSAIVLPLVASGIRSIVEKFELGSSMRQILKEHPELRNDPNVPHYFQMLSSFSPSVATNPLLAGNLLKKFHETGPSFVQPGTLKELVEIQTGAQKLTEPARQQLGALADVLLKARPHTDKDKD